MIVVADSNPLIGLAKGKVFHVLRDLFGTVNISSTVWTEVHVIGTGRAGATEIQQARDDGWLHITTPGPCTHPTIAALPDTDDQAVLTLAHDFHADRLITDDRQVRTAATRLGIPVLYTADIAHLAKAMGLITSTRTVLDTMRASGFGIRESVYQDVLRRTGEATP